MALLSKERRLTAKQHLGGVTLCLSGCLLMNSPVSWASTKPELKATAAPLLDATTADSTILASLFPYATTATPLFSHLDQPVYRAYIAQSQVVITGVRVEETETGAQIVLETTNSELATSSRQTIGNALIVDIQNAVLALPGGGEFQQTNPTESITSVAVTNSGAGVRVEMIGIEAPPTAEVSTTAESLTLSIATDLVEESDEGVLQLVVTGERDEGYNPSGASTATRTDTPLRDIPQSIQVVPRQVIEDQGITRIGDALRNVSGVTRQRDRSNASDRFTIRGFDQSRILRNGFRTGSTVGGTLATAPNTVERIEVIKGPASVLYGQVEPGGVVNFVTEQPSRDPFYDLAFTAGSFGYIEPSIDLSGPLTADERLTYRLNTSYQNSDSFRDFVESDRIVVAPTLRYEFSDATSLTFEYVHLDSSQTYDEGLPIDPIAFDLPRERTLSEPDDTYENTTNSFYLTLDHRFNDTIRLRSGFGAELSDVDETAFRLIFDGFDPETGNNSRQYSDREIAIDNLSWQTDLISEFNTGSIEHQLLAGFELARTEGSESRADLFDLENILTINVFDPQYGTLVPDSDNRNVIGELETRLSVLGLYLQNQVALLPNLKLLVGGRYDFTRIETESDLVFVGESFVGSSEFNGEAFSPRVGLVYQPIEPISLYASYSRSFVPTSETTVDGDVIEPERGTQYEVGVRGEFGDVSVNLAAYDITKTNIARTDPNNPSFSIPVGEVRSRGIELDVAGKIVDGWNIIGSLFFNDAFISEGDDNNPEDDILINAPDSGASLWTTYEIQTGDLQGLGFGAGLFYVGDREAEIPNDVVLPSYVRGDASIFYNRDNWQAQLNFQNLFNTDYFESTQNTGLIFPGAPFTIVGRISVRF
ncbi:MAG: TonB-dependent siderophore receptor [Cyanobacteria bacterium P01_H01_bin.21]